jgi:hypothetical protein
MGAEVEEARVALEFAEDAEKVTGIEILRWLHSRPKVGTVEVINAVERAINAAGRAKRLRGAAYGAKSKVAPCKPTVHTEHQNAVVRQTRLRAATAT